MSLDTLVRLLTLSGLVSIMLSMGMKVKFEEVLSSLKDRRLVMLSLLANFVVIPAVTIALLDLFNANAMVSVGFLILAVCPGAPVAPPFTAVAKGDVAFATGQMAILAALSAVLSPVLLKLLLPQLVSASDLRIDYLTIVQALLAAQMLPLGVGLGVRRWSPKLASRISRPLGMTANILLLSAVAVLLAKEYQTLSMIRPRGWSGMLLLLAASLGIGWLCGGPARQTRKALALTTAGRNAAVALVIVSNNFANTAAVTAVIAYALVSILATLACAFLLAAIPEPSA